MKGILLFSTLAVFAQSAFAQMGQGYSFYTNYGLDAHNNLHVTTLVDGAANCNSVPPGWNCGVIRHTGKAFVTLAGVRTETDGSPVTPNAYISVSNTGTLLNPQPGLDYSESSGTEIFCSVAGLIFFQEDGGPVFRINDTNFILEGWDANSCDYFFWCPNGNLAASCRGLPEITFTPEQGGSGACRPYNYLHTHDLMVGGVCTYTGTVTLGNQPIPCN